MAEPLRSYLDSFSKEHGAQATRDLAKRLGAIKQDEDGNDYLVTAVLDTVPPEQVAGMMSSFLTAPPPEAPPEPVPLRRTTDVLAKPGAVEHLAAPAARLVGAVGGALEETGRTVMAGSKFAGPAPKSTFPVPEGPLTPPLHEKREPTAIESVYDLTEQDFQRIITSGEGQGVGGWGLDLVGDVRDNIVGILEIGSFATGYNLQDAEGQQSFLSFLKREIDAGRTFGGIAVGGMVGGMASFLANPLDALEARPFSTAMMVLPLLKSVRAAGKALSPKMAALAERLEGLRLQVKEKLPAFAGTKRLLTDPSYQAIGVETARVEEILNKGKREAARTEASFRELGRAARRGELGPDDVRSAVAPDTLARSLGMAVDSTQGAPSITAAAKRVIDNAMDHPVELPIGDAELVAALGLDSNELVRARNAMVAWERLNKLADGLFTRTKKVDEAQVDPFKARFDLDYESAYDVAKAYRDYNGQNGRDVYWLRKKLGQRLDALDRDIEHSQGLGVVEDTVLQGIDPAIIKMLDEAGGYETVNAKQPLLLKALGLTDEQELALANAGAPTPEYVPTVPPGSERTLKQLLKMSKEQAGNEGDVGFMQDNMLVPRQGFPLTYQPYVVTLEVPAGGGPVQFTEEMAHHIQSMDTGKLVKRQTAAGILPSRIDMGGASDLKTLDRSTQLAHLQHPMPEAITEHPVMTHPLFARLAGELQDSMKRGKLRRTELISMPEKDPALRGLSTIIEGAPSLLTNEESLGIIASAFHNESNQLLRSPKLRKQVIDYLYNRHPLHRIIKQQLSYERLDTLLQTMGEGTLTDKALYYDILLRDPQIDIIINRAGEDGAAGAKANYLRANGVAVAEDLPEAKQVELGNLVAAARRGARESERTRLPRVRLQYAVLDAMQELGETKPKVVQQIRQQAIENVGKALSEKITYNVAKQMLVKELRRYPAKNLSEFTDNVVRRVLVEGEAKPLFMHGEKPKEVGRYMRTNATALAAKYSVPEKRVIDLSKQFITDYGDARDFPEIKDVLPFNLEQLKKMPSGVPHTIDELSVPFTAISKGLASSMGWSLKAARVLRASDTAWGRFFQGFKANLTILNLSSHKNNFVSNFGFRVAQTGIGPGEMTMRLGKSALAWKDWADGTASPEITRALNALDRTGLLDTTLMEGEIGAIGDSGLFGSVGSKLQEKGQMWLGRQVKKPGEVVAYMQEKSGKGYKLGDNLFKLDMGLENFQKLDAKVGALEAFDWLEFEVDPRRIARVETGGDGTPARITVRMKDQWPNAGKDMPLEMLDEFIARGAGHPAQQVFFDYGDVPNFLNMLRSNSLGGLVSPFLTWGWKALDIPRVKKGLLGAMLSGDGGVVVRTSNKAINGVQAIEAAKLAMRRSLMINMARQQVLDAEPSEARDIFKYATGDSGVLLLDQLTDPTYTSFTRLDGANWFEPTETLFQFGAWAWSKVFGTDAEKLFDENYAIANKDTGPPVPEVRSTTELRSYIDTDDAGREELLQTWGLKDEDMRRRWSQHEVRQVLNRRELWARHASGETFNLKEVLGLIGMSGTPIVEGAIQVFDADERGTDNPLIVGAQTLGPLIVGATPWALVDVAMGAFSSRFDAAAALSTRRWARSPMGEVDDGYMRWVTRRLTGLGWRTANTPKAKKKYLDKVSAQLLNALDSGEADRLAILDADAERAKERMEQGRGSQDEVDAIIRDQAPLRRKIEWMKDVVKDEITAIEAQYDAVLAKMKEK